MSRRCIVTGKGVLAGNNVSHSNRKNRRRFLPNLQKVSFLSESTGDTVRMRLSTRGIRTVEKRGGIDAWLMSVKADGLTPELRALRRRVEAKQAAAA